jgi:hypothetical protein
MRNMDAGVGHGHSAAAQSVPDRVVEGGELLIRSA